MTEHKENVYNFGIQYKETVHARSITFALERLNLDSNLEDEGAGRGIENEKQANYKYL